MYMITTLSDYILEKLYVGKGFKVKNLRVMLVEVMIDFCINTLKMEYANYILELYDKSHKEITDDDKLENVKYIHVMCDYFPDHTDEVEKILRPKINEVIKVIDMSYKSSIELIFEV